MQDVLSLAGAASPLDLTALLMSLAVGVVLAVILRLHFQYFGSTLSNREEFAQVFPFILLTTILIISVVKSSLALSLGLVGALSIVRFRTPIKEPEELAYLFMSIAMGLGLGANQILPTVVSSLCILAAMAVIGKFRKGLGAKNIYLSVDWHGLEAEQPDRYLEQVGKVIERHSRLSDLRRFDVRNGSLEATYFLDVDDSNSLTEITEELRNDFPQIGITFLDQNQLPSV